MFCSSSAAIDLASHHVGSLSIDREMLMKVSKYVNIVTAATILTNWMVCYGTPIAETC